VVYGNFHFAESIGLVSYQAMQSAPTDHLLGEWLLRGESISCQCRERRRVLEPCLEVRCSGFPADLEQRKNLMRWVRAPERRLRGPAGEDIVARKPRIVGCSSVFQAALCFSGATPANSRTEPGNRFADGGANCEGEMGVERRWRAFPWVDCVVSGEADAIFADLCGVLLDHGRTWNQPRFPTALSRKPTFGIFSRS